MDILSVPVDVSPKKTYKLSDEEKKVALFFPVFPRFQDFLVLSVEEVSLGVNNVVGEALEECQKYWNEWMKNSGAVSVEDKGKVVEEGKIAEHVARFYLYNRYEFSYLSEVKRVGDLSNYDLVMRQSQTETFYEVKVCKSNTFRLTIAEARKWLNTPNNYFFVFVAVDAARRLRSLRIVKPKMLVDKALYERRKPEVQARETGTPLKAIPKVEDGEVVPNNNLLDISALFAASRSSSVKRKASDLRTPEKKNVKPKLRY